MSLTLLFQNEQWVAVDKPAMMLSVRARFADDPRPVVGVELEKQLGQRVWPIHRLDYEVSGLMLFALNAEAHRAGNRLFERREVQKSYQAFTGLVANPPASRQVWKRKILRGKKRSYESPHGEWAETEVEFIESKTWSEWRLFPKTGKPHQLRMELALQGFPIVGDQLYGSTLPWPNPGLALRALSLQFPQKFAEQFQIPEGLSAPKFPH